jgi:hypothetical protein
MFNDHDALFSQDPQSGCLANLLGWVTGIILLLILCALSSCRSTRTVIVEARDSTSTHVHTNTVFVPDTILVPLPPERVMVTIPDTASILRTSLAESHAAIRGGLLHHELRNLPAPLPVPVQTKVITRDSIIYRSRDVPVPYPVDRLVEKPLTWWQHLRLWLGNILLIALLLAAAIWALKKRTWWLRLFK